MKAPKLDLPLILGGGFFLLCLFWHTHHVFLNWNKPIADFNVWRQAQTALTTRMWLENGAIDLACPLPVFGEEAKVPFEFPLYQVLVYGVVKASQWPLEQTGRALSLLFFWSIFPAVYMLLRGVVRTPGERLFVLAFLLMAPTYIAYSRAFLIESFILAISVWFLFFFRRWLEGGGAASFVLSLVLAVLGGMVKITCFFPFAVLAFGLLVLERGQSAAASGLAGSDAGFARRFALGLRSGGAAKFVIGGLLCGLAPLAANFLWTAQADAIKAAQPLAQHLQSHVMHAWNFGTLPQRLSVGTYRQLESFANNLINNRFFLLWVLVAGGILVNSRKTMFCIAAMYVCFLLPIAVFINLWHAHDYYWYENGIFILVAFGLSLSPALLLPLRRVWVPLLLMLVVFLSYSHTYRSWYGPVQREKIDPVHAFGREVQQRVPEGRTIVVSGFDWDPAVPYYARRPCLMDIHSLSDPLPIRGQIETGRDKLGAVVLCREMRGRIREAKTALGLDWVAETPAYTDQFGELYLPEEEQSAAAN